MLSGRKDEPDWVRNMTTTLRKDKLAIVMEASDEDERP